MVNPPPQHPIKPVLTIFQGSELLCTLTTPHLDLLIIIIFCDLVTSAGPVAPPPSAASSFHASLLSTYYFQCPVLFAYTSFLVTTKNCSLPSVPPRVPRPEDLTRNMH